MINSGMKLREIFNNSNPQPSDFTSDPVYKTLRHLPFFKDAYDSTKAEFERLNDKSVSFVSMFDVNLKKAFNKFVDRGGKLNASKMYEMNIARKLIRKESNDWDNPTNAELDAERQEAERVADIMRADQETARMLTNRSPEAIKLADKIRQATLLKFAKKHGDVKAGQMIYGLEQNNPDYFIKKANMDIMGIQ